MLNRTPYEALLGPIKCGIRSFNIPEKMLNEIRTEEDLEKILTQMKNRSDVNSSGQDAEPGPVTEEDSSADSAVSKIFKNCFSKSKI